MFHTHSLKINGESIQTEYEGAALQLIRNHLGLTASRYGCGQEQCGACHVLIDGQSKPSCQLTVDALEIL